MADVHPRIPFRHPSPQHRLVDAADFMVSIKKNASVANAHSNGWVQVPNQREITAGHAGQTCYTPSTAHASAPASVIAFFSPPLL
jgi:hypothetical protein